MIDHTNEQPEPLRLADLLDDSSLTVHHKAAAELRRLYVSCDRMEIEIHRLRNQRDIQADRIAALEQPLKLERK